MPTDLKIHITNFQHWLKTDTKAAAAPAYKGIPGERPRSDAYLTWTKSERVGRRSGAEACASCSAFPFACWAKAKPVDGVWHAGLELTSGEVALWGIKFPFE